MGSAIKWVRLDHSDEDAVAPGDMVSVDAGGMPIFKVLRCQDGVVWLGGEHRQTVLVQPLATFRWKAEAA